MAECTEEIEIELFRYDEDVEMYYYPCPCGEKYEISKWDMTNGETIATCSACSSKVKVLYNQDDFQHESDTMPGESPGFEFKK